MQNDKKAPAARRIDLSNCKLLSPYGMNPAENSTGQLSKVGAVQKVGILLKTGLLQKVGVINKPRA